MDEGDGTLTESCEEAVNFMVVELRTGSLHELPGEISKRGCWENCGRSRRLVPQAPFCFFANVGFDQLRRRRRPAPLFDICLPSRIDAYL